jgi:hypothetical protein
VGRVQRRRQRAEAAAQVPHASPKTRTLPSPGRHTASPALRCGTPPTRRAAAPAGGGSNAGRCVREPYLLRECAWRAHTRQCWCAQRASRTSCSSHRACDSFTCCSSLSSAARAEACGSACTAAINAGALRRLQNCHFGAARAWRGSRKCHGVSA